MARKSLEEIIREWEEELGPEELAKAQYHERMRLLRFIAGPIIALAITIFWIPTGLAARLRDAFGGGVTWLQTWEVIAVFLVVDSLLTFPMDYFFDFYSENRLGTNRQSFKGWLADEIKEGAINLILQSLIFTTLYMVFRHWPHRWFWGTTAIIVAAMVVFYLLEPWILRMKFKAEPLENPSLEKRLRDLFAKANVPFGNLAVLKTSEKSSRTNAALVPKGKATEVVIFDTLLDALDEEAIAAVIAHELGHKVHHDMLKAYTTIGALLIGAFAAGYEALKLWGSHWGLHGATDVATFPLLAFIIALSFTVMSILFNIYGRYEERAADRFALEMTGRAEPFVEAMRVLARTNKILLQPPKWVEALLYNHPSVARRVQFAYEWEEQLSKQA